MHELNLSQKYLESKRSNKALHRTWQSCAQTAIKRTPYISLDVDEEATKSLELCMVSPKFSNTVYAYKISIENRYKI
jgi:hypothetical protein